MKKIIALILILLIGMIVIGGCTSNTVEPTKNQQEDQNDKSPEVGGQEAGSDGVPQPPALPEE